MSINIQCKPTVIAPPGCAFEGDETVPIAPEPTLDPAETALNAICEAGAVVPDDTREYVVEALSEALEQHAARFSAEWLLFVLERLKETKRGSEARLCILQSFGVQFSLTSEAKRLGIAKQTLAANIVRLKARLNIN